MDNYVVQRIVELQRAIEKLKVSMALTKTSEYTIEWIRDNLEADPTFYAWIVTSLEADVTFYNWFRDALEADVTFYNWFRDALEADVTFISSLVNSFSLDLAANNWVRNTATYSAESFITLTRTATQSFTSGVASNFTWQSVIRNSNNGTLFQQPFSFTPPNANITIPQSGYYNISIAGALSVSGTKSFFMAVNGSSFVVNTYDNQAGTGRFYFTITNYFDTGDVFNISMTSSVTATLAVNAEKTSNQSPILHIVKINAAG